MGPSSNINKSMDNKNSCFVEELGVVCLNQKEILKDKISEFFLVPHWHLLRFKIKIILL